MTDKQFLLIYDAVQYRGNKISMFADSRSLNALKKRGDIAEYKDGWYYVRIDCFLRAIKWFEANHTGAVEQAVNELKSKFYANSEKLHNS